MKEEYGKFNDNGLLVVWGLLDIYNYGFMDREIRQETSSCHRSLCSEEAIIIKLHDPTFVILLFEYKVLHVICARIPLH